MPAPDYDQGMLPVTPKGGGVRILAKWFQDLVINAVNAARVTKVIVPQTDGTNHLPPLYADIKRTALGGTIITLPANDAGGGQKQVVYMKACLDDGTVAYVPVIVSGTIYRDSGSGTVTPAIDAGAVPAGSNELI